ncbi:sulfur carrier protein ThiS [Microbulbifer sp. OS29]|uniref:Sulfur carrier protein ThiS n=1 Tax=Microbulbifer okhotskensis TaxID=2926617 RepID=A0A9X2J780_9GAMM|nr:sulfur carrier protein ThiS [Microbulbifer okhotskensis]MCO1335505.1 sulfur carrier protein ThiS [Microbulbifer okhotskensis]
MQVLINGDTHSFESSIELVALLEQLGYRGEIFAVAVNGGFVARSEYSVIDIHDGDSLDIVAPVVGG